jgi:mannosyltransferase OCH1-like enzyme
MNQAEKTIDKPLECPIPHKERKTFMSWVKKLGFWGFMFFLLKGLILYIFIPYLIAKGFIGK